MKNTILLEVVQSGSLLYLNITEILVETALDKWGQLMSLSGSKI